MHVMFYPGHSSLQNNVLHRLSGCVKHGRHHHQHIRPAWWKVGGEMQQNANTIFIISCHWAHFT